MKSKKGYIIYFSYNLYMSIIEVKIPIIMCMGAISAKKNYQPFVCHQLSENGVRSTSSGHSSDWKVCTPYNVTFDWRCSFLMWNTSVSD